MFLLGRRLWKQIEKSAIELGFPLFINAFQFWPQADFVTSKILFSGKMIENETVRLEPLSLIHAAPLSEWIEDSDMWTWWLREPPTTLEKLTKSIELALEHQTEGDREPFAVFSKSLQKFVGETSLWSAGKNEIEIGSTWLCRTLRGTGFNKEVKKLLIGYARQDRGVSRIILQTDELNIQSQRAIQAIGGIEYKRMKGDKIVWDGRIRTSIYYKIETWENQTVDDNSE